MSYAVWASFLTYNVITHITPGPNNIVALNAAGNAGMKSRSILVGMFTGLHVLLLLCGLFTNALGTMLPDFMIYMRYIGAAYIFWLAVEIARSRPAAGDGDLTGMTFLRGFLLQFANVKAIIYGIFVFSVYVLPNYDGFLAIAAFSILMAVMANLCAVVWATAGFAMKNLFARHWRILNIVMALMLASSALSILVS